MSAPQLIPLNGADDGGAAPTGSIILRGNSSTPLAIRSELWETLCTQIDEGMRVLPRGGAEVGGLLVARKTTDGTVSVEQLVAIPIEYRFGPSFRPSPSDFEFLEQAVEAVQKRSPDAVVGFYRSRTRGDVRLRDNDLEIFQAVERVHTSYAVNFRFFMVLAPLSRHAMSVQVAFRQNRNWGDWHSYKVSEHTVESLPETLQPEAPQEAPGPPASPPWAGYPPPGPRDVTPEPPRPAAKTSGARRVPAWFYVAASIVLLAGALEVYGWMEVRRHPAVPAAIVPAATPGARTGFAATPEGSLWKLTWKRDAVAALHPTGAVLSIRDGDNEQEIPLTEADLASEMVFYTPQSGSLLFRFTVLTPDSAPVEEHVRALVAGPPVRKPAEPGVRIIGADRQVRTLRPFTRPPESHELTSAKSAGTMDVSPPPLIPAPGEASLSASAATNALPPQASPAPPRELEIPPVPAPVPRTLSTEPPAVSAAPPPRASAISPAVRNYVGPKPIRRMLASASRGTEGPTTIQVRVEIDAAGKVAKVEPLGLNVATFRLAQAAILAARSWTFEPARENGEPVPSDMILSFAFDGR